MITIVDSSYGITEAVPRSDGYTIREHAKGDLNLYIEYSNAIHAWGLHANATSFVKDIEALTDLQSAQAPSILLTPTGSSMGPPPLRS